MRCQALVSGGLKIKLVQAPGATPNQKPGPGAVDWHITLKGDGSMYAVDASGNQSAPVSCLVPPPPSKREQTLSENAKKIERVIALSYSGVRCTTAMEAVPGPYGSATVSVSTS